MAPSNSNPTYVPRSILVTGGAGFIGSNFIHRVLEKHDDVRIVNLDRLTYAGTLDNLVGLNAPERHEFVQGDICDSDLVAKLLRDHDIDSIVHFAAESHVDRSIDGPAEFVRTNINGTFSLLEAAREVWAGRGDDSCRFHHISTDEVYGSLTDTDPAFHEETPYAPNSPYSAAKASADHLVRAYFHTYGLPVVTTNCSNNYGPRQHFEKLIPTVVRSCFLGRRIPVYGDGSNVRDWLYVTDHCDGIDLVLRRGRTGESYNIGGEAEHSNLELVKVICGLMDEFNPGDQPSESLIEFVTDRPGHDWRYAIDISKIQSELGWAPAESLESGLRRTLHWYMDSPAWRESVQAGAGGERLGLSNEDK